MCDKGIKVVYGDIKDYISDDAIDLWNAYKWLKEYHSFPILGGWTEQSSKFIRCVKLIDLVNLRYTHYLEADKKVKADFAGKFNNMMGSRRGKK